MFERYAHYLSYGATDQRTVRDLMGEYSGLLVPGTVAAFQREGTGGFVLALSARTDATDYVIDPRSPLFQQSLSNPKQSHLALADLLGVDPQLFSGRHPEAADFEGQLCAEMAERWVNFNTGYTESVSGKFAKYAKRLNEPVLPSDARAPTYILAPYFIAEGPEDPWWDVSARLYEEAARVAPSDTCVRVVAVTSPLALGRLLDTLDDERAVIWVSGLQELETPPEVLAEYARVVAASEERDQDLFALYGGFFSVLLASFGLDGQSHGVGYGEYRSWLELPQSGPPPARYYLPRAHRYVSQELAHQMWLADRTLAECDCAECEGQSPLILEYHELMKHSVRCRSREIREWAGLDVMAALARLRVDYLDYRNDLNEAPLPQIWSRRAQRTVEPMDRWTAALELAVGD
jgi:hypothetical protein